MRINFDQPRKWFLVDSLKIDGDWLLWAIFILLISQALLTSFYRNIAGPYVSPVLWTLLGWSACLLCFWMVKVHGRPGIQQGYASIFFRSIPFIILLVGSGLIGWKFSTILPEYPIDPNYSDIIPALKLYVTRFLAGEDVYAPMDFGSWTVIPNYLPIRWMVFIPAEWLGLDYRSWSLLLFFISLVPWYFKISQANFTSSIQIGLSLLPLAILTILLYGDPGFFGFSVELSVVAAYLFLGYAMFSNSTFLLSIAILCCLLSRFSFTFWLPAFLIAFWIEKGWRDMVFLSGIIVAGVLGVYILPFLSKNWGQFSEAMAYYRSATVDHWYPEYWQNENETPFYVNNGLSYTYYFYSFAPGDMGDRVNLAQRTLTYGSLALGLLLFIGYRIFSEFRIHWVQYWWIGLIFYLFFFYSLMSLPFPYLFMLPILLASVILIPLLANKPAAAIKKG